MPNVMGASGAVEPRIRELGEEILAEARGNRSSLFDPARYTEKLIEWAMAEEEFRTNLFRFVDVLPVLGDAAAVVRHVQEYFGPVSARLPAMARWGLRVDPDSFAARPVALLVRQQVRAMARRFIIGEDPRGALKDLQRIRAGGAAFTVDLLGEAALSEEESETYLSRYLELIDVLAETAPDWKESRPLVEGHPGERSPFHISVKLSALYSQAKPQSHEKSVTVMADRLGKICSAARRRNCFVTVDMEEAVRLEATLDAVRRVLDRPEFRDWDGAGIVLQAYLRRSESDLEAILDWVRARGAPISIRLVKGAYWDTETILARLAGWSVPVWEEKAASDLCFERMANTLLEHTGLVFPAFGSHNVRSLCAAISGAEARGVSPAGYELQMLYGMADPVKRAFVRRGYLVREYVPVGELIPGMGYLVRRLLENTSNEGFIHKGLHDGLDAALLLQPPESDLPGTGEAVAQPPDPRAVFRNAPWTDFSAAGARAAFERALEQRREQCGENAPVITPFFAGRRPLGGESTSVSDSPEDTDCVVARVREATQEEAKRAMDGLSSAFPEWRDTPVETRSEILIRAADLLDGRRLDVAAAMVIETGKPWIDADADVAEAIDFLRYYGREALKLMRPRRLFDQPGERSTMFYEPRGPAVIIAPWNFPSAIPCGMFAAALVTGNTAVLKPAEQSPLTGWEVFRALREAGLPEDAAAFMPGAGETVGRSLAESPLAQTIVFTGSREVGLSLVGLGSVVGAGQEHVKRVIAEMGGKNAIVVDSDADLDEAVKGVVSSAFGYAGQKCSACSRVFVVRPLYSRFCERLCEAVKSCPVGPASDPATVCGPLIDDAAVARVGGAIERAERGGVRLLARGRQPEAGAAGRYVTPAAFADVPFDHELMEQELFGPVVATAAVETFEEGIVRANANEYGLTGAVYSRSPRNLRYATRAFRVGNLYLNRGCTGSLVGRHPFGGAKMSGVGSKAGGPDYLMQFVIPRVVCENTMRRGFAPME